MKENFFVLEEKQNGKRGKYMETLKRISLWGKEEERRRRRMKETQPMDARSLRWANKVLFIHPRLLGCKIGQFMLRYGE